MEGVDYLAIVANKANKTPGANGTSQLAINGTKS